MKSYHIISDKQLDLPIIRDIILTGKKLKLSEEAIVKVEKCRSYLDHKMKKNKTPIYGINTGFGSLYNVKITNKNLTKLQENLVMSHACGTGEEVPKEIVKLMFLFKIQSLSYGYSAVQLKTINRLIDFYNHDIYPIVYTQGSLGASGDLSPLAHLSLPLIGKGRVVYKDKIYESEAILKKFGWDKIELQSKEGLALLNGTQFMSAYGVYLLLMSHKTSYLADVIASISLDAFDGKIEPFHDLEMDFWIQ